VVRAIPREIVVLARRKCKGERITKAMGWRRKGFVLLTKAQQLAMGRAGRSRVSVSLPRYSAHVDAS